MSRLIELLSIRIEGFPLKWALPQRRYTVEKVVQHLVTLDLVAASDEYHKKDEQSESDGYGSVSRKLEALIFQFAYHSRIPLF